MLNQWCELWFIICWVVFNFFALFGLLKVTGQLRVSTNGLLQLLQAIRILLKRTDGICHHQVGFYTASGAWA